MYQKLIKMKHTEVFGAKNEGKNTFFISAEDLEPMEATEAIEWES